MLTLKFKEECSIDIHMLGSKGYENTNTNYGDCFLVIDGRDAVIYDCGSEEHAQKAIEILDNAGIEKAVVILSHNDDDHFRGIPYLIEEGRVEKLFTVLLLKYKDQLLDKIDDGRRNRDSISQAIKEKYDNIASLSGKVKLRDVYENADELPSCAKFVGPDFDYMLGAAAKGLDGREGNTIDLETVTNAASVQIRIQFGSEKLLLTGDCTPAAIPEDEKLRTYKYIQLPHHGKAELAEMIFERTYPSNSIVFLISDNTGNTNGGSDKLKSKGHNVKNTKVDGTIKLKSGSSSSTYVSKLGV